MTTKTANGVFYTVGNPFDNTAFRKWAKKAGIPKQKVLEPFAGANDLIKHLRTMRLCNEADSFDICPAARDVKKQNTLHTFPQGYPVCITNPPWLAKNRATRMGIAFPDTEYDDLYKLSLKKCLINCDWLAAVVPESFIRADLFQDRLTDFVSLRGQMFTDTDHPVGLAMFSPSITDDVMIWHDNNQIGLLKELESKRPRVDSRAGVRFNAPDGNVGLIAIDNTRSASIRFCEAKELDNYQVRHSCRSITKIAVDGRVKIKQWNDWIKYFRKITDDVLLTSFKGRRRDGAYRRRMDFALARGIINNV